MKNNKNLKASMQYLHDAIKHLDNAIDELSPIINTKSLIRTRNRVYTTFLDIEKLINDNEDE